MGGQVVGAVGEDALDGHLGGHAGGHALAAGMTDLAEEVVPAGLALARGPQMLQPPSAVGDGGEGYRTADAVIERRGLNRDASADAHADDAQA